MSEYKEIPITKPAEGEEDKSVTIEINLDEDTTTQEEQVKPEVKSEPEKEAVVKPEPEQKTNEHNSRAQKRIKQLLQDKYEAQAELEKERKEKAELLKQMQEATKNTKTDLKSSLEAQIASLTKQMTVAMTNGEAEQVVALQDALIEAKMELKGTNYALKQAETYKEVEQVTESPRNTVPDKALDWIEEHSQFKTDPYFRSSAIVENNQLLSEGYDPKSDEFYAEINKRLGSRFPKIFGVQEESGVQSKGKQGDSSNRANEVQVDVKPASKAAQERRTEQTVSGSSRASASHSSQSKSTSVTLSPEDVRQAEAWGIPLEQMARRKAHSEANKRVDGYVSIMMNH